MSIKPKYKTEPGETRGDYCRRVMPLLVDEGLAETVSQAAIKANELYNENQQQGTIKQTWRQK